MIRRSLVAVGLFALLGCAGGARPSAPPSDEVTRLADEYVREYIAHFPEAAELYGLRTERHDGLNDNSLAALADFQRFEDRLAERLATLRLADFEGTPQWVILGFLQEAVESSRQVRVCRYELWPVNQLSGWQALMAQLADAQPVGSDEARSDALARWSHLPRYLDNEIANLREGVRLGYTAPQANVRLAVEQLDGLLAAPVEEWPFYSPARRDGGGAFAARWRALLADQVLPAVRRYRDYLRDVGPRFDLRAFHDVVLGSGAITLPMLRQKVESWIRRSRP